MQLNLVPHPAHLPSPSVSEIVVDVGRWPDGRLQIDYSLYANVERLCLPPLGQGERKDGLWQTTCFEFFLRRPAGYWEFNFSPSQSWAAYSFADYRAGMQPLDLPAAPDVYFDDTGAWSEVEVLLALPDGLAREPLSFGLAAVVEEKDGTKSYWALAHPNVEKPDFHHRDCFVAQLA